MQNTRGGYLDEMKSGIRNASGFRRGSHPVVPADGNNNLKLADTHTIMPSPFPNPVPPYPGWIRREYHLSHPVTHDDIAAFLGNEELYVRETAAVPVNIIHKFGLVELHCIVGEPKIEIWFAPDGGAYPSEYLDALLATRF
ncbi:MAG: hypothetical protein PHF57_03460 [Methanoregula sp.]|nr:hypothetical protein [Methanoregula sp.]MDD5023660.1 hypothetical protein [Methanoregula sp.]MDD5187246.1 hypothetical protein [Methanoregula sp.]